MDLVDSGVLPVTVANGTGLYPAGVVFSWACAAVSGVS